MNTERVRGALLGSKTRVAGTVTGGLALAVAAAFLLGVIGAPGVAAVENRFAGVNDETTTVETDMVVSNPNPVGVSLGDTSVNYTVFMNDVAMASGDKEGLTVGTGNSTLEFSTQMRNDRIPPWWHSHVENGERTEVRIDARVRSGLLGGREIRVPQRRTIETNMIGQFNSTETRPIEAGRSFPSDPILIVNETSGVWDREDLTRERTPIRLTFDTYNPKEWPYAISEIGYTITMNGVQVGEGSSEDVATILPRSSQTLETTVAIRNQNLDEWWVTHLENDQVTDLEIEFYAVVDPSEEAGGVSGGLGSTLEQTGEFRVPLEPLDYRTTIETDIFGTKNATADGEGSAGDAQDDDGNGTADEDTTGTTEDGTAETTADDSAGTTEDDTTATTDDGTTPTATTTEESDGGGGLLG
ncbi:LEA type 2 family protein [Halorientalis halophila]|uniref:LEA type 2 family protein n=1 Tax=Halorientalis halophila TaxID=3108499 RepID=UPI003009028D